MLLGAHESTSGGLHEAFARALADGAEAVQIFTKSSRMWRSKEITAASENTASVSVEPAGLCAKLQRYEVWPTTSDNTVATNVV